MKDSERIQWINYDELTSVRLADPSLRSSQSMIAQDFNLCVEPDMNDIVAQHYSKWCSMPVYRSIA